VFFASWLLVLAGVCVEAQQPETQNVSGTWSLELVLPDGDAFTGALLLQQEADQITGTWRREGEKVQPRVSGEIKGKAITFSWIMNIPARSGGADGAVRMSFAGEVDGDIMSGTASLGRRAEDLNWTAERDE